MSDRYDCERLAAIELDRAAGKPPAGSDLEFREDHLACCPSCRAELAALDLLRGAENSGPLAPLDDIARRRLVDTVLAADATRTAAGARARDRRVGIAAVAAAASVAAAVIVVVVAVLFGTRHDSNEAAVAGTTEPPETARVLLGSGDARVAGSGATLGSAIAAGTDLATGSGEIWIGLPFGFTVALSPDTRVTLQRIDTDGLNLVLDGGRLLAATVPGRQGPALTVETRAGAVTVRGTVLGIEDRAGDVEVHVARGWVEIDCGADGRSMKLGPAEKITIGDGSPVPSSSEEDARMLGRAAAFCVLDPEARASIEVRSVPSGATVEVDGAGLGATPLVAAIRAGHRRIVVALPGRPPISEMVSLAPGAPLSRFFEFQPEPDTADLFGDDHAEDAASEPSIRGRLARTSAPQELLAAARERRVGRDFNGAAKFYEELLLRHPSSDEARAAQVSLGQLELDHLGRSASALDRFDAYLRYAGPAPLRAEALLGRARALRKLGRREEERAALELFLERHPEAIQRSLVRQRLKDIVLDK